MDMRDLCIHMMRGMHNAGVRASADGDHENALHYFKRRDWWANRIGEPVIQPYQRHKTIKMEKVDHHF